MKTEITTAELGIMDDAAFIAHCHQFPKGSQWLHSDAFRYAAVRLARIKGLF